MEAQFADHFGAIDDQLMNMKEAMSEIPDLKLSVEQLRDEMPAVRHALAEMQTMLQQLLSSKEGEESSSRQSKNARVPGGNHKESYQHTTGNPYPKLPRMDFPRFNGEDSYGWVRKAERFFEFNPIDEPIKVNFASIHFDGQAEFWFGTYIKAKGRVTWDVFVRDLNSRFASLFRESIVGEFHKLRHTTTVESYYNEFEALRSILVSEGCMFKEDYYIQSFIGGLKDEIRLEVEKFELYDLSRAIFLARKQEASISNGWQSSRTNAKPMVPSPIAANKNQNSNPAWKNKPIFTNPPIVPGHQQKAILPTPNTPPIQRLTRGYFDDRRRKGLCYWCDENFTPAHNCKHRQVSMLIVDDEREEEPPPVYDEEPPQLEDVGTKDDNDTVEITNVAALPALAFCVHFPDSVLASPSCFAIQTLERKLPRVPVELGQCLLVMEPPQEFTYHQLCEYSNNWNEALGQGSFGDVYKGKIGSREVAIKVAHETKNRFQDQWNTEVQYLQKLNHLHIIKLIGYSNDQGNLCLVYELMKNGSVHRKLAEFDWITTVKVAVGAALAMKYMHEQVPALINRDFRAPNILLDEAFNPKLSDLALVREEGVSWQAGSHGYTDWRTLREGLGNRSTDMHGMGIFLLQLITKEQQVVSERGFFNDEIKKKFKNGQRVLHDKFDLECSWDNGRAITEIALQCVEDDLDARPTIDMVIERLRIMNGYNNLKVSVEQLRDELTPVRQSLAEMQGLMQQLVTLKEGEGSSLRQFRHQKGPKYSHKEYTQTTTGNPLPKLPKLDFLRFNGVLVLKKDIIYRALVGGLRDEIRLEVEKFELHDLSRAIYLARKQEAGLFHNWSSPRAVTRPSLPSSPNTVAKSQDNIPNWKAMLLLTTPTSKSFTAIPGNQSKAILPTPNLPSTQRLSRGYFDDRRRKGVCYWCDETFTPAHNWKHKQVSMLVDEKMEEDTPLVYDEETPQGEELGKQEDTEKMEITLSLHPSLKSSEFEVKAGVSDF
ncbi:hypothetical protein RJ640_030855 [Escallonia rubra]|uniref:Protein kinase domain-containing protein n=1 Tax=Escallonia rubra TaxID=112253 RepID=A0AA88U322_9ASTE|nr:hypothetical protein RJ640_030855 [Escallonia rubra]